MQDLTEQQRNFALEYARNGGKGAEAARKAGFSVASAGKYAYQLLEKPHVLEAIHREQRRAFTDLASLALAQARAMLESEKTPPGARVQLIMTVCDRAGLAALRDGGGGDVGDGNDLRSMSIEELEALAARFRDRNGSVGA